VGSVPCAIRVVLCRGMSCRVVVLPLRLRCMWALDVELAVVCVLYFAFVTAVPWSGGSG